MPRTQSYSDQITRQLPIVAYLDGLQAKINALRELQSPTLRYGDASQSASEEELSPSFHFGDASQSAGGEELRPLFSADVDAINS